jgi:hypothetical protein
MPFLPQSLAAFTAACQARFGADAVGSNDDGAFIAVGGRTVHVNLDVNANRVVFWTELPRPAHISMEAIEEAAIAYTRHALLDQGLAIGIDQGTDLILLGRSAEQDVLAKIEGVTLVAELAREAGAAGSALAARRRSDRPVRAAGRAIGFHS